MDWKLLADLKDALMESDLPFRVDVLDYHTMPEQFRENVKKGEIVQPLTIP